MSSIKINKDEGKRVHIWIKSAIGTPNRRQFKHKNIMYPYFRMYKSPYRARDSRTRQAFWPCVDKYPWHTHQKRWVKMEQLNIKFFSEFTNRPPNKKNLFEVCHTLPFNGINCLFWNPIYINSHKFFLKNCKKNDENEEEKECKEHNEDIEDKNDNELNMNSKENEVCNIENKNTVNNYDENKKIIRICNFYYIVDKEVKNNVYFYLKYIKYTMRPFRGKIIGDLYLNERKIRDNISAKGIVNGEWKFSFPHIKVNQKVANITLNDNLINEELEKNIIKNLVIVDKYTYRPPLPKCFSAS
ncbi:conserved Plasmodium protein, unknown function [Plasmodium gallinaceum]|uniref:Uncharacterized protein n=1 Tax=Plasmodium gallinaceum TaxID=5849 RepID=A0A1J1GQK7_PLAGA|nr:conserved Plasmodium protein, unknown function [Plasmodium gallinaceum]CRG94799.1 conserved Plasmodium protein, unknown function [Plasmodium gallinaceum]